MVYAQIFLRCKDLVSMLRIQLSCILVNLLTAGAGYIRVFIIYWHIRYQLLNMVKRKCDTNQQDLKRVDLHFVKSE